jgi:hypothetical protein
MYDDAASANYSRGSGGRRGKGKENGMVEDQQT